MWQYYSRQKSDALQDLPVLQVLDLNNPTIAVKT